ncbi:MAG TPA: hypothetical protein VGX24_06540 [Pyrinomonadaceae bacterium]|nr:hypothetical protein [Pyrinomonadaceae bacterium]
MLLSHTRSKNCPGNKVKSKRRGQKGDALSPETLATTRFSESQATLAAALVRTKFNSVIKQQKERAFGFDREASPLLQFS